MADRGASGDDRCVIWESGIVSIWSGISLFLCDLVVSTTHRLRHHIVSLVEAAGLVSDSRSGELHLVMTRTGPGELPEAIPLSDHSRD